MIKISYLYPNRDDGEFDLTYFCNKHIPFVKSTFGDALRRIEVEKGIQGAHSDSKPEFVVAAHLYFDSIDAFQETFEANKRALLVDLLHFTNMQSVVQFSKILLSDASEGPHYIEESGVTITGPATQPPDRAH